MNAFASLEALVDARLSAGCRLFEPYEKQRQFFALGAEHDVRCLSGGNRTGKTAAVFGGEIGYHLTGLYPDWWVGRRFDKPVVAWCGSTDWTTNIYGCQMRLVGDVPSGNIGRAVFDKEAGRYVPTGLPAASIIKMTAQGSVAHALSNVTVRHVSGGVSQCRFIAYSKGREKLQGGKADIVGMDEEPPMDVATELMARTMDSRGITLLAFTPLKGMSDVVRRFVGDVALDDTFPEVLLGALGALVRIKATDAPHLTPAIIEKMKREYPKHEHAARMDGIPALGEGAVFPFADEDILVPWFVPPAHFRILDGIDFGFTHPTARVRGIMNPDTKQIWLIRDYRAAGALPSTHVEAWAGIFKGRVPVVWPHDGRNTETDGTSKRAKYQALGVPFTTSPAELPTGGNSLEGSVQVMYEMFASGLLKVFRHACPYFMAERSGYRREKKKDGTSEIVKQLDDAMDAGRYCIMGLLCGYGTTVAEAFDISQRHTTPDKAEKGLAEPYATAQDLGDDDPLFN